MPLRWKALRPPLALLALLTAGTGVLHPQYSTPVGKGEAKKPTLRATAVLEWTGSLQKPNASRLMPIAVWDGEQYQPAGLYLAQPAPLAFATGTQYELERSGEPAGLFDVRGAAQLQGEWIGMGKFQAEAPPPPPPKLKPSKKLPALSNGKPAPADTDDGDRPTLHRKGGDAGADKTAPSSPAAGSSGTPAGATKPDAGSSTSPDASAPADPDHPTLHRRAGTDDGSGAGSSSGSGNSSASDPDRPTLHRKDDSSAPASSGSPSGGTSASSGSSSTGASDPDRPTLHRHDDSSASAAKSPDADPDRPTLHRAKGSNGVVTSTESIDPDRPHLRHGQPEELASAVLPEKLEGAPAAMQQIVAVSDTAPAEPRSLRYQWPNNQDPQKMQAALAAIAAQAVAAAGVAAPSTLHPARRTSAGRAAHVAGKAAAASSAALVDERFSAYELAFSAGPTLVYSAHTADEGAKRVYVTLIAQPDFYGNPQVLLKQVARGDRLDETPSLRLVDAVDTDGDGRAELVFELNSQETSAAPANPAPSASRQFAIYRVAAGQASQVFVTEPLP